MGHCDREGGYYEDDILEDCDEDGSIDCEAFEDAYEDGEISEEMYIDGRGFSDWDPWKDF